MQHVPGSRTDSGWFFCHFPNKGHKTRGHRFKMNEAGTKCPARFMVSGIDLGQFVGVITISTRRFSARPAALLLVAMGS